MKIEAVKSMFNIYKQKDLIQIILLMITFALVKKYMIYLTINHEAVYHSKSYLIKYFSQILNVIYLLPVFILIYKLRGINWFDIELKIQSRVLMICFGVLATYKFGFNSYNFFYDQLFLFERILLIILFALSLFKAVFVIPFAFIFYLNLFQYNYPIGGFSLTDLYPWINFFPLIISFFILKKYLKIKALNFWRVLFVFQISYYFFPGIAKIEISPNFYEWVVYNDLSNLFKSSLEMGWLPSLNYNLKIIVIETLHYFKTPLNLLTVFIEISSIYFFPREKYFRFYLIVASIFHLMIFLFSGIFFWKWIVLNLSILVISYIKKEQIIFKKIFDLKPQYFFILTLISVLFLRPLSLAWFDSNYIEKYEIGLVDSNNHETIVSGNFFKPYDKVFSQNRFNYLNPGESFVGIYGTIGSENLLLSDFNPMDFFQGKIAQNNYDDYMKYVSLNNNIEKGEIYFDSIMKRNFHFFLKKYLNNYNNSTFKNISFTPLHIIQPNKNEINDIVRYNVYFKRVKHNMITRETKSIKLFSENL